MEGFLAADIDTIVQRAIRISSWEAIKATISQEFTQEFLDGSQCSSPKLQDIKLTNQDFAQALVDFVPISLRNVPLLKSEIKWSDVGGLSEARETLKDTLELPMR